MSNPNSSRSPMAGGFLMAAGTLIGAIGGAILYGQPSLGFVIGLGVGAIGAVAIWLFGRNR